MILRFSSGSVTPASASRNVLRVHRHEADAGCGDVVDLDLAPLVLLEQAVVDEHAHELVADGLVHDRGGDGRVHAAREPCDDAARADLLADPRDLLGDHVARVPVGGDPRGLVQEVLDHVLSERRVLDLGMPLHAVEALLVVRERRDGRRRGRREHLEAVGRDRDGVAVAHPRSGARAARRAARCRRRHARSPRSTRTRGDRCAPPRRRACCAMTWKP